MTRLRLLAGLGALRLAAAALTPAVAAAHNLVGK